MENCVFLDTTAQEIVYEKPREDTLCIREHGDWFVAIDQKELNTIFAAITKPLLSPWSYLFIQYTKEKPHHALYLLIAQEHVFLVTFDEQIPIYWKIVPFAQGDITNCIEQFLKEFYQQEKSYFIEQIICYAYRQESVVPKEEIEEKLFVEVAMSTLPESIPCDKEYAQYVVPPCSAREQESFWKRNRIIIIFFFVVFIGLLLTDMYLRYRMKNMEKQISYYMRQQVLMANRTNHYTKILFQSNKIDPYVQRTQESNAAIVDRLRNIFALIPDTAYLTHVTMHAHTIQLEGIAFDPEIMQKRFTKERGYMLKLWRIQKGYRFIITYKDRINESTH